VSAGPGLVRVLPEDLANQIAAGEVVERPASVVKELIENALDAGARRVRVDIEQGGVGLVRVADDGAGMEREDARLSVLRHATSKLGSIDDLHAIQSFGFRGEALPSIASVSRFELRTRRADDPEGTLVRVVGGGAAEVSPCGCAAGTAVEVRDLFFNVPARRKFLKTTATESARVTEVLEAAALGEPGVTLMLTRDKKTAGEWLRASSREERVRGMFAGEELAPCKGARGPLSVEAYLSRPERARQGAVALSIFVNGRPVRDRTLARSVALAYGSVLEAGRYPVGVVYLDLSPELVDVNVHPQKAEVRFADGRAVSDALYKIIGASIRTAFGLPEPTGYGGYGGSKKKPPQVAEGEGGWVFTPGPSEVAAQPLPAQASLPLDAAAKPQPASTPAYPANEPDPWGLAGGSASGSVPASVSGSASVPASTSVPAPVSTPVPAPVPASVSASALVPEAGAPDSGVMGRSKPIPYPTAAELAARAERKIEFSSLRFVAQVRATYLICEGTDGLYVIDQHAAAERVTFYRLRKAYDARSVPMQPLLFGEPVTLTHSEVALVEERQDDFLLVGLDVRPISSTQVSVRGVPLILTRASPEQLVRDFLGEISHAGERAFSGAVDRVLATMACHGSLRAGDPVPEEEARALLASLDESEFAGHCPHGRPVAARLGWSDLERHVGRR